MIFKNPNLLTKLEIWRPKYSTQYGEVKEWVALLACYKVDAGSPWILVEFTKAKHLSGQRYYIKRQDAQNFPIVPNGKIGCYEVPLSKFEHWSTTQEIKDNVAGFGW